ncbi:MAG: hypothetical protein US42_C0005G0059 [Candidatus Magasanikbacteria bacterium GW2011_GWC2_37_14]|uniref:Uncharacterized protein n=1 Tax=Candidatus Magasanikbacteria bacterium GW2011_GWC2_37_14 TaxID=1619046 RepID=A0A0G0IUJ4_9BACT|nr:MAG: hypothetical protein US42_C0005G0059 [Candidatus Magasanikbacteria bacterium GW2011_GWC2_37_14]
MRLLRQNTFGKGGHRTASPEEGSELPEEYAPRGHDQAGGVDTVPADQSLEHHVCHVRLPRPFDFVDALGQGVGGVVIADQDRVVEEDRSSVEFFGDEVHADRAGGQLALVEGGHHGFVHVVAVHARTAVLVQRTGVDVDGLLGVETPDQLQPAGQRDEVGLEGVDEKLILVYRPGCGHVNEFDAQFFGASFYTTTSHVGNYGHDVRLENSGAGILHEFLEARASTLPGTRSEYENPFHV